MIRSAPLNKSVGVLAAVSFLLASTSAFGQAAPAVPPFADELPASYRHLRLVGRRAGTHRALAEDPVFSALHCRRHAPVLGRRPPEARGIAAE